MNIVRGRRSNPCLQHVQKDHQSGWWGDEQGTHMAAHLERAMSRGLKQALAELVNGSILAVPTVSDNRLVTSPEPRVGERTDCLSPLSALDAGSGSAVEHAITVAEKSALPGRESRLLLVPNWETPNRGSQWPPFIVLIFKRDGSKR